MHTPRSALRGPLDDKFIWSLVLQQRRHLLIAGRPLERACCWLQALSVAGPVAVRG